MARKQQRASKKLYERVNIAVRLEERRFLNYFDETVRELEAQYGDYLFINGETYKFPKSLTENCVVRPLYHNAIMDNILYLAAGGDEYKGEFIRKARLAYHKYWGERAKGMRIRRARW